MLGVLGGIGGYLLGTLLAMILGPIVANVPVLPVLYLMPLSLGLSISICLIASYFPARLATKMDPSVVLQEI